MSVPPRIEAIDLRVRRGGAEVLRGVGAAAGGGNVVGLIGPNGSGKSTLLMALAGLIPPAAGSVRVDGSDLAGWPADQRARRLGYLEQTPAAHWPVAVEHVVGLGRMPHRRAFGGPDDGDRAAVATAIERCGLADLSRRPVSQLSGGERARVMLARVLAGDPGILLADEPVSELDPYHQLHVMDLIRGLADEGRAVIVVLHDLSLALRFCDHVLLLDRGEVAASGPPDRVIGAGEAERVFAVELRRGEGWAVPWKRREAEAR